MNQILKSKDNRIYLFLLATVVIILSLPVLQLGTYYGHDLPFHLQRIVSMERAISEGNFFARIYTELYDGYGYGVPLFYPQLFLYIPALLYHFGLPLHLSYNFFVVLVNIATVGIAFYSYTKLCRSKNIGFVAAVLYSTATYRLVDLYTRSSVGEYLALTFLPLYLLALTKIVQGESKYWFALVIATTGVLQSHILSFVILVLFSIIYLLFHLPSFKKAETWKAFFKAIPTTILLNAWFLIPFLDGNTLPIFKGDNLFVSRDAKILQLFDLLTNGATKSEISSQVAMPKTPGLLILVGLFLLAYYFISNQISIRQAIRQHYQLFTYTVIGIAFLLITLEWIPWGVLFKINFISAFFGKVQFVWRFYMVVMVFLCPVATYGFVKIMGSSKHFQLLFSVIAIGCSLIFINNYAQKDIFYTPFLAVDNLYLTQGNTISTREELESNIDGIIYTDYQRGNCVVQLNYIIPDGDSTESPYIDVPIAYYPGYVAYVNGEKQQTELSPAGVVQVKLTDSTGSILVKYEEKTLYKVCNILSVATLIFMCGIPVAKKFKKKGITTP